jgi:hypothetical protein
MTIKDVTKSVKDDYELWYKWIEFLELCSTNKTPLSPTLKNLLATGLAMDADEPFIKKPFRNLVEIIVKQKEETGEKYSYPYYVVSTYKQKLIQHGYLLKDGTLHPKLKKMRKTYMEDVNNGVHSISVIFKICVC